VNRSPRIIRRSKAWIWLLGIALLCSSAAAQAGWNVLDPEDDFISFAGLGSMFVEAFAYPDDMDAFDTALVVACDPESPVGFEASLWVDYDGRAAALGETATVLLRADQGTIAERTWILVDIDGFTEALVPYEETDAFLNLLRGAQTLALRVNGAPGIIADRTFQFDVRGFEAAFAQVRCAAPRVDVPPATPGATSPAAPAPAAPAAPSQGASPAWGVVPGDYASAGAVVNGLEEVLVVFCRPDGNGIGIDVGAYGAASYGPSAEAVFRSGSVDFLRSEVRANEFGSYELVDDATENRLVRNLRLMTDVTVTLRNPSGGSERRFTLTTAGFSEALSTLGCYQGAR